MQPLGYVLYNRIEIDGSRRRYSWQRAPIHSATRVSSKRNLRPREDEEATITFFNALAVFLGLSYSYESPALSLTNETPGSSLKGPLFLSCLMDVGLLASQSLMEIWLNAAGTGRFKNSSSPTRSRVFHESGKYILEWRSFHDRHFAF